VADLKQNYVFYGQKVTTFELETFLGHVFERNDECEKAGLGKTPVCVWGMHGIGKTESIMQVATRMGYKFGYLAPAQFEEMGDLVGMPRIDESGKTVFATPEWVPREEGPGILLLDDANRADQRILRGLMQLLQRYELVSWKLPPRWQIVLTANPDGGDYAVTPMDAAMLTRMLHVTLEFNVKAWARWADSADVDPRGIDFVLAYPEVIGGERTTPRSLVQLFKLIGKIPDLGKEEALVSALAHSTLDREAAAAFMGFVRAGLSKLITPAEILAATDFQKNVEKRIATLIDGKTKRVDILNVVCTRLAHHLAARKAALSAKELGNLKSFLTLELIPADMRLVLAKELVASGATGKKLLADPEIATLVMAGM
jgi:hypothetical protein